MSLTALFLGLGLSATSAAAAPVDTKMLDITVKPVDQADQVGPGTFYLGAPLTLGCRYQWGKDVPKALPPPLEIRFYSDPYPVGNYTGILGATKVDLPGYADAIKFAAASYKTDTLGSIMLTCRVTDNGYLYKSSNSNDASVKIQVVARPPKSSTLRGPAPAVKAGAAGIAALTPYIKSCPTSLSATVKVDAYQLVGPQQSPADVANTTLMLHFKGAEALGNNVVCRYATENKDVPDLVVTIKCPNASSKPGQVAAFSCTN